MAMSKRPYGHIGFPCNDHPRYAKVEIFQEDSYFRCPLGCTFTSDELSEMKDHLLKVDHGSRSKGHAKGQTPEKNRAQRLNSQQSPSKKSGVGRLVLPSTPTGALKISSINQASKNNSKNSTSKTNSGSQPSSTRSSLFGLRNLFSSTPSRSSAPQAPQSSNGTSTKQNTNTSNDTPSVRRKSPILTDSILMPSKNTKGNNTSINTHTNKGMTEGLTLRLLSEKGAEPRAATDGKRGMASSSSDRGKEPEPVPVPEPEPEPEQEVEEPTVQVEATPPSIYDVGEVSDVVEYFTKLKQPHPVNGHAWCGILTSESDFLFNKAHSFIASGSKFSVEFPEITDEEEYNFTRNLFVEIISILCMPNEEVGFELNKEVREATEGIIEQCQELFDNVENLDNLIESRDMRVTITTFQPGEVVPTKDLEACECSWLQKEIITLAETLKFGEPLHDELLNRIWRLFMVAMLEPCENNTKKLYKIVALASTHILPDDWDKEENIIKTLSAFIYICRLLSLVGGKGALELHGEGDLQGYLDFHLYHDSGYLLPAVEHINEDREKNGGVTSLTLNKNEEKNRFFTNQQASQQLTEASEALISLSRSANGGGKQKKQKQRFVSLSPPPLQDDHNLDELDESEASPKKSNNRLQHEAEVTLNDLSDVEDGHLDAKSDDGELSLNDLSDIDDGHLDSKLEDYLTSINMSFKSPMPTGKSKRQSRSNVKSQSKPAARSTTKRRRHTETYDYEDESESASASESEPEPKSRARRRQVLSDSSSNEDTPISRRRRPAARSRSSQGSGSARSRSKRQKLVHLSSDDEDVPLSARRRSQSRPKPRSKPRSKRRSKRRNVSDSEDEEVAPTARVRAVEETEHDPLLTPERINLCKLVDWVADKIDVAAFRLSTNVIHHVGKDVIHAATAHRSKPQELMEIVLDEHLKETSDEIVSDLYDDMFRKRAVDLIREYMHYLDKVTNAVALIVQLTIQRPVKDISLKMVTFSDGLVKIGNERLPWIVGELLLRYMIIVRPLFHYCTKNTNNQSLDSLMRQFVFVTTSDVVGMLDSAHDMQQELGSNEIDDDFVVDICKQVTDQEEEWRQPETWSVVAVTMYHFKFSRVTFLSL